MLPDALIRSIIMACKACSELYSLLCKPTSPILDKVSMNRYNE